MQRTREQLEAMTHAELVERILEMQDMLREGLAVRDSLHAVLNTLLKAKAEEVAYYASAAEAQLDHEGVELKKAWAAARHAVSNPYGLMLKQKKQAL
jgi:ribosomal protein L18